MHDDVRDGPLRGGIRGQLTLGNGITASLWGKEGGGGRGWTREVVRRRDRIHG